MILQKRNEASAQTTPLIGRDGDCGDLLALWSRALDGEGQVVTISGEAGIGKSRIVEEFRRHLVQPNLRWLEAKGVQSFENSVSIRLPKCLKAWPGSQMINRLPNKSSGSKALSVTRTWTETTHST